MHSTCLKDCIRAVPQCVQTTHLETVLGILYRSERDCLVVTDDQQRPIGLVQAFKLLPYLMSPGVSPSNQGSASPQLQQPIVNLGSAVIDPLNILPENLPLEQVWQMLQSPQIPLAVVNARGVLLGLLDPLILLKRWNLPEEMPPHPSHPSPDTKVASALSIPASLVDLLERLPLPLMLQTSTGKIVAQNRAWCSRVGEILDPAWVGQEAAAQLAQIPKSHGDSLPSSQANSESTSLCQLGTEPDTCICICPMKNGSDQVLQFVKIPLVKAMESPPSNWVAVTTTSGAGKPMALQLTSLIRDEDSARQLDPGANATAATTLANNKTVAGKNPSSTPEETLWLVLAQDVTEQHQIARELTAKNADLVQLNRLKDEFLACISHELKTPLTAVLGLSSLLKDRAIGDLNDRQTRYAQLIHQSGRHLMMVVNDILDLTRIETGQLELALETINIAATCERAIDQAKQLQTIEDRSTPSEGDLPDGSQTPSLVRLEIAPGLETLVADDLRLRQMLYNLLSNALKFTDTHGTIGLRVSRWAGWIAFTVWDTGIGIPAEKQHLIFQKFQQLENPLTRRFEGTGLGLVLTQRLARLHGGDVTFTSREGEGSEFTLLLPPCPPQEEASGRSHLASVPPPSPAPGLAHLVYNTPNRLMLIVEAVPQDIDHLNGQLTTLGYPVVIARSGTEALEKARKLQPCIIFLNPLLPLLSGWDVLTLLKADPETRHIPAVVTATCAEREQAYKYQADGFLSMPIQLESLQQTINSLNINRPLEIGAESPQHNLAVLRLKPESATTRHDIAGEVTDLNTLLHSYHYRVLEADDLEQAELLARVWKPKVVLLDSFMDDPLGYLQQLSHYSFLSSLPLITLDRATTLAANQVHGLSAFPCLLDSGLEPTLNSPRATALLQAIQVAAGFAWRPLILAVDISQLEDLLPTPPGQSWGGPLEGLGVAPIVPSPDTLPENTLVNGLSSHQAEWLRVLMQYVQTAGYRGLIGRSWTEVLRQLQHRSADLLLLRWQPTSLTPETLGAIANLERLSNRPPIIVLDQGWQPMGADFLQSVALPEPIRAVATQVLPASTPIAELLEQIKHTLWQRTIYPET